MSQRKRGPRGHPDRPGFDRLRPDRPPQPERPAAKPPRQQARPEARRPVAPPPGRSSGGGLWLYGQHAVTAALANPRRRWRRLVATAEARDALPHDAPGPEILARAEIDRLVPPGSVHQGIALLAEPLTEPVFEEVIDAAAAAGAPLVVLDQVTDPHNVGAILRSAAAFGAGAVVAPERNAPRISGVLAKSASGAVDIVPFLRVVNLARALRQIKEAGFWCVGLDAAAEQTLAAADLTGRIALVLGAEGAGLRRLTRETCDTTLRLPTRPPIASLNVSNAAAVALYELARRR